MRASRVLQKCLPDSLSQMHALRECALLQAVEALLQGRRLTLTDVARSWPGAERIRAPLKAFDRLLGNPHLQAEREPIHQEMAGQTVSEILLALIQAAAMCWAPHLERDDATGGSQMATAT